MILNENLLNENKKTITETYGVKDATRLSWMAEYMQNHMIKEGLQAVPTTDASHGGIYATPLNTFGMGSPVLPNGFSSGSIGAQATHPGTEPISMSTLAISMEIAATTIGFDLLPVIPSKGPWMMMSYNDYVYAGGKLNALGNLTNLDGKGEGSENKPIYIKINGYNETHAIGTTQAITGVDDSDSGTDAPVFTGKYMGKSRIDGEPIYQVISCMDGTKNVSIADVFKGTSYKPELVSTMLDHLTEFSNFYANGTSKDPMSRAENETGTGNTIGARLFTKMVQMGGFEVTGAVTRQQLQDMPLYGIDIQAGVLETMQNEISQGINNRILDRVFRMGVENAANLFATQNIDLNLNLTNAAKTLSSWSNSLLYVGLSDIDNAKLTALKADSVPSALAAGVNNMETFNTLQRRIMSRVLAASNVISNTSRQGGANWAVVNTKILTALQDCSQYVMAPMENTLKQNTSSLYKAGTLCGTIEIYVDPYMNYNDTRVCLGRKMPVNAGKTMTSSGVAFVPYILADSVSIVAEGTMAPKYLMNSRFAIVNCGMHPETSYYTFMVETGDNFII